MTDTTKDLLAAKLESIISGHKVNEDDADWLRALAATQQPAPSAPERPHWPGRPDFTAVVHGDRLTLKANDTLSLYDASVLGAALMTLKDAGFEWKGGRRWAAPEQPSAGVEAASLRTLMDVTLEGEAADLLRSMLGEDEGEPPTSIRLLLGEGHSGYGLYVAQAEYQDQGAFLLCNTAPPSVPVVALGEFEAAVIALHESKNPETEQEHAAHDAARERYEAALSVLATTPGGKQ